MLDTTNTNNSALLLKGDTMESNMVNEKENDEMVSNEKIDWDCKVERRLFYAMRGLKPVGVNRHFMMVCIHKRFSSVLERDISSKVIWDHLDSLYDMAALHESEILPFPNEEVDYDLPSNYYDLAKEQLNISLSDADDDSRDSKSELSYKSSKKSNTTKSKQNGTPVSSSKTTFATPVSNKNTKQSLKKSESKPSSISENKTRQESPLPSKLGKVKRSSSPFTSRNSKSDTSSVKEDTPEPPAAKKLKPDTSTPLSTKKTSKPESNSASKKSTKQEQSAVVKPNKTESSSSSAKKLKNEKDSAVRKSKVSTPTDNTPGKKGSKVEGRRSDHDSSRRSSDIPLTKNKSDRASSVSSRGSKHEDSDSSIVSGSRKSSPAVRGDSIDRKKKKGSPMKRRRT